MSEHSTNRGSHFLVACGGTACNLDDNWQRIEVFLPQLARLPLLERLSVRIRGCGPRLCNFLNRLAVCKPDGFMALRSFALAVVHISRIFTVHKDVLSQQHFDRCYKDDRDVACSAASVLTSFAGSITSYERAGILPTVEESTALRESEDRIGSALFKLSRVAFDFEHARILHGLELDLLPQPRFRDQHQLLDCMTDAFEPLRIPAPSSSNLPFNGPLGYCEQKELRLSGLYMDFPSAFQIAIRDVLRTWSVQMSRFKMPSLASDADHATLPHGIAPPRLFS